MLDTKQDTRLHAQPYTHTHTHTHTHYIQDDHYAVIVKPPALLTHKSFGDGADVKKLLPKSLKP